jgi:phosphoglycolate phosphatase
LDESFREITGNDRDTVALVAKYRDRYGEIGYAENVVYPGITQALLTLSQANIPMAICTSKRQDFARRILELFDLIHHFQFISGGEVGVFKYQQIESLRSDGKVSKSTMMVGDRHIDLIAAHKNGLKSGGVLWGYGSESELRNESPLYLFRSPNELTQLDRSTH